MQELFEKLIIDSQSRRQPVLTEREVVLPEIEGKVNALIGMRRSGKTFFLFQQKKKLIERGVPSDRIMHLSFEDERILPLDASDLHFVTDAYYKLYPEFRSKKCYFFFDEIQNVKGWESYLRRIQDTENADITITGSSAKMLSQEISTSLRGRGISTEILPFSFREVLVHRGIELDRRDRPSSSDISKLQSVFDAYIRTGGFPEIQKIHEQHRVRVLQEYVDAVIFRDIVERHEISNFKALRYLIRFLLTNSACLFSINKFYNDIKSQGLKVSKDTLFKHLDYVTQAYLLFTVSIHSKSERARMVNPQKVYVIDTGIAASYSISDRIDYGHFMENIVYLDLRRRNYETIEYYRTEKGCEVDFIASKLDKIDLIQVCSNLDNEETRNRELRALRDAMKETGIKNSILISLHTEETLALKEGTVKIIPVYLWLLQRPVTERCAEGFPGT